ncbi:hypothetical protein M8J75_001939 [Diaphorina citri]|nr:hypothetical protein M8J75_001939 [Diaphorina citri]
MPDPGGNVSIEISVVGAYATAGSINPTRSNANDVSGKADEIDTDPPSKLRNKPHRSNENLESLPDIESFDTVVKTRNIENEDDFNNVVCIRK